MPGGVEYVVDNSVTTKNRIKREKSSEHGRPGENDKGDQNQKTAISSQMALTSNGFGQHLQLMFGCLSTTLFSYKLYK